MKYRFNKIFPLLIKPQENAEKLHFGPNLGLLGPNLGPKIFFGSFSSTLCYTLSQTVIMCSIKQK